MVADSGMSAGELSRRMSEVLSRFEGLTKRLEEQFVRRETMQLLQDNITLTLSQVKEKITELDNTAAERKELDALAERIKQLEDDKKWLIRLVIGVVIVAVLGLVIATGGVR
jgi:ubiquinone biosynthesis protein UbiJ